MQILSDVSVVIPVRNGAEHVAAAIASVAAQPVREIIVVDDGSSDATADVIHGLGMAEVRYVRQGASGAAAARNRGVALASGELLAFLDADDLWLDGKIARQQAALAAGAGDMIFSRIEEFVSPELSAAEAAELCPHAGPLNGVSLVTMLMRRADFLRVGPFDESVRTGEFLHWYARAQEAGLRTCVLPELLARRRLHRNNHGRSADAGRQAYAGILREMLLRRRASGSP